MVYTLEKKWPTYWVGKCEWALRMICLWNIFGHDNFTLKLRRLSSFQKNGGFQVVSRLDDSKKKKLEKEFVPVSDAESDSDDDNNGRGSEQSDLESEGSSLSEDDGKDWKQAVKEQHKQIRFVCHGIVNHFRSSWLNAKTFGCMTNVAYMLTSFLDARSSRPGFRSRRRSVPPKYWASRSFTNKKMASSSFPAKAGSPRRRPRRTRAWRNFWKRKMKRENFGKRKMAFMR